jgi:DNA-binding transcriptional LysR family regulator
MQPTQAGEVLLSYARQMLVLQEEARAQLAAQHTGTIRIGTIETLAAFYLPPVLQAFRATYPRITLSLQAGTETSILQAVKEGDCDLGLLLDHLSLDPELVCLPLRKEEFVIVARPDSPYGQRAEITVQELANAHILLTEEECTYRGLLLQELKQSGTPHQIVGAFGSLEAIKQCVMAGLGIAFLPLVTVQEEVAQGKLHALLFAAKSDLYTQAIYLKRRWHSSAFQHLVKLMGQKDASEEE